MEFSEKRPRRATKEDDGMGKRATEERYGRSGKGKSDKCKERKMEDERGGVEREG